MSNPSEPPHSKEDHDYHADYDLSRPLATASARGLRQGLTSYGDAHFSLFLRKAFIKAAGLSSSALARPIIGIATTASGFNPCHANSPALVDALRRGVLLAGGLPVEFPTISLHESFAGPSSSMFLRNLMSVDTEEMVRAQPVDAVVLVGGCDKTVPAQLMGAVAAGEVCPALPLVTGPMMPGSYRGVRVGACTDCRGSWARFRAGEMDVEDIEGVNDELAPTSGTCGVMGTASTMACITAALGLIPLRAGATAPAVSAARLRVAEETGKNAVHAATHQDRASLLPTALLTRESFLNAITVLQAVGGSTNAVVHLLAIINRHPHLAGTITLADFDAVGRATPLLVDLKPSGSGYMTDFHDAGGMPALLTQLRPLLHLDARTITGRTLGEALDACNFRPFEASYRIVRPLSDPLYPASSLVVLTGNLAPRGAVMKASASKDRRLLQHSGPACVFRDAEDLAERLDDPELRVTRDSVLVLQNIGPRGHPGMPEAGMLPIPRKLAREGVEDMVRVSDGRMSGTAGGTVVLHVSPEAKEVESVLGIVRDEDVIRVDLEGRRLDVLLSEEEIRARIEERKVVERRLAEAEEVDAVAAGKPRRVRRGYRALYDKCVNQADEGADFDFLTARGI
ncbi:dihydroxy-acid dehydratase [Diplodia corticola]|uniref:Dihydroxy-acid dehydratase n=1 Tax=Diplodia corticola TaxID=236234 RepID=A0A1J9SD43_9PEZI|nr:dihydroxy-acid dehydratase [Diplodia corticola]OJD37772.1 dihydroxy-acid dehydratase [Diplodia corticola]